MGDQIKQAFQKLKAFWGTRTPKIKKMLIIGLIGLLAVAVALTVFLNIQAGKETQLFPTMEVGEATEVFNVVQELGYQIRMNDQKQLFVPTDQVDEITMQLALQYYPKSKLTYDIFDNANGLTSTDFEKRQVLVHQSQDRLQDTINRLAPVESSIVTLNMADDNQKVWETTSQKSSASVTVILKKGEKLSSQQVSGIKWLVASGFANMDVTDVKVIDSATSLQLKSAEDEDPDSLTGMLERLNLEQRLEQKYEEKVLNLLTMVYKPEDDALRVSCTVQLDYSKMIEESKQYQPPEQSTDGRGMITHQDTKTTTQGDSTAQGIPGEENNTDVPLYPNQLQDNGTYTDSSNSIDYVVGYIMRQIEKDQAELKNATIAVALKGEVEDATRQSIIANVAKATNIPEANISVENYIVTEQEPVIPPTVWEILMQHKPLLVAIGAGVIALLVLIIVIMVIIARSKKRKKESALLETAQAEVIEIGDQDTEFNLQQELEERKRQLRESSAKTADEAIADEVRDFAKTNPEITANLLRAWMKEEID